MLRGRLVLLFAPLLSCSTSTTTSQTPATSVPQCQADASALTAASGASVADTAQMLAQVYALVGAVPALTGTPAAPTSLAELQAALLRARDAVQPNRTTLADAIKGVDTLLGNDGAIYERATDALSSVGGVQTQYSTLANQVNALVQASGLSIGATTQAVQALRNTSGVAGSLADTQTALASLMTSVGSGSLSQVSADYLSLQTAASSWQGDANRLLTLTGASGGLGDVVAAVTSARDSLNASANTLTDAVAGMTTSLGGAGSVADQVTAVGVLLGGTGSLAARAQALSDGLATGTDDALTKLAAQLTALKSGSTVLASAVSSVNTTLGGTGSVSDRAGALTSDVATLLTDSGSAALSDVDTLVNKFKTCVGAGALQAAQSALCPGGYASLACPQGNGGNDGMVLLPQVGRSTLVFTLAPSQNAGVVSLGVNDGAGMHLYSADTSSLGMPITVGATVTFVNNNSGDSLVFLNNTGGAITNANALTAALGSTFGVGTTMVAQNTCAGVAALEQLVGIGNGGTLMTRLGAISGQLALTPSDISTDLANAVGNVEASSSTLEGTINDVAAALGGSGSLAVRAADLAAAVGN